MNDTTICSLQDQSAVSIYTVVIYAPLAAVYVVVAILFIKHPNAFHPLFVLSFFLMLLAYTTSNFILFFRNLFDFITIDFIDLNPFFTVIETIFYYANFYTQPIVVLTLLERLAATVWVSHYEKSCHWVPYFICQGLCVGLVILMSKADSESSALISKIQFFLSFVICICLVILFFVNRSKTMNANSRLSLTTRYQLAENIKALRLFVPFLVLDNVIAIMFVITNSTIGIERRFRVNGCGNKNYIALFVTFRTIAILFQISMAVFVIYQHESLKFWKNWNCMKRVNRTEEASLHKGKPERVQIKNVLGKTITEQETAENYFTQLHNQWGK